MDIETIYNALEGYKAADIYQAYRTILGQYNIISLATSFGIAVSVIIFYFIYVDTVLSALGFENKNGRLEKTKDPDFKRLLLIFRPLLFIIGIVAAYPYIINWIENYLLVMSDSIGGELGPVSNLRDAWRSEARLYEKMMARTSDWDIMEKFFIKINYWGILTLKPFLILLEQDIFSLFLTLRYLYLTILIIFGGIAFACLLHPDTKVFFFTWLKHMLFCNMFIAILGIANAFVEIVYNVSATSSGTILSYNILAVAFTLVVKLFLFRQAFFLVLNKVF